MSSKGVDRHTLARFIRNQVGLADRPPAGHIQLNNAEALMCAEALEHVSREGNSLDVPLWAGDGPGNKVT